jgi:hypothetical protein
MFKCQVLNRMSQHGDKCNKIVVAKRDKTYTSWFRNEDTGKWEEHEVGRGWEIVKEVNATDAGLALWESWSEADKALFAKAV